MARLALPPDAGRGVVRPVAQGRRLAAAGAGGRDHYPAGSVAAPVGNSWSLVATKNKVKKRGASLDAEK